MTQLGSVFDQAMSPKCASNVKALMCRSAFKECRQVEDASGSLLWFPSLPCRSECERHQEIWNSCLNDIAKDPEARQKFDAGMVEVVQFALPRSCAIFFCNGRACLLLQVDLVHLGISAFFQVGIFHNVS
jgi:hypothetical protein